MDNPPTKGKLWHRIKYRNSIAPSVIPVTSNDLKCFDMTLKKRLCVMQYLNKMKRMKKSEVNNVKLPSITYVSPKAPDDKLRELCQNCPTTSISYCQEQNILRKVKARGLETKYSLLVENIMSEAREEFLKVTQQSGIELKLTSAVKTFQILPYKCLGKTQNYAKFLQMRKELQNKFILHQSLVQRMHDECVSNLPYELIALNFKTPLDANEFQKQIFDYANEAAHLLQQFYRKMVSFVEHDDASKHHNKNYLGACTGLLSLYMSRSLAHTLLYVANFTASKEHKPYLQLKITFQDSLILEPTSEDIINIYEQFLMKLIDNAKQFYVLEKYRMAGYDNKYIHLCLTEDFFKSIVTTIRVNITEQYEPILKHIKKLNDDFANIYEDLSSGDKSSSVSDLIFEEACKKILYFKSYLPKIAFIPDNAYFIIGQLTITEYREVIKQTLLNIIENIFNNLCAQHEWENNDICETFNIINVRATQKVITTEELIETGKYMTWVRNDYLNELKERVMIALTYLAKLIQLGPLKDNHIKINASAINWLDRILPILEENNISYEQLKFEAEEKLQRVIEEINVDIKDVYPLLEILDAMDNIANVSSYLNTIILHMVKIKAIATKIDWINREEVALSFPKSSYVEFEELKNYVYPFYHLLKLSVDVQRHLSVWLDGQFDLIRYEKVKETVEKYNKDLIHTQKTYRNKLRQAQDENLTLRFKGTVDDPDMLNWPAPLKLCANVIKLIQEFELSLVIIRIMCNQALMDRHWQKMSQVAGFDITPNAGTTLRKMIRLDLKSNIDKYDVISSSATKERELLKNLQKMKEEWNSVIFTMGDTTDIKVIIHLDEIEIVADDHLIKVINMISSIYVKPYERIVKEFYNLLLKILKAVEEIRQVQYQILHFCPMFTCPKICKEMPQEATLYNEIIYLYNGYLETIIKEPIVHITITNTNILEDLINCDAQFEIISKGVTNYFHKIRQFFSRLYFISDEEMFHMLASTTDLEKIKKQMKSLFRDVKHLYYNENMEILGIVSDNNQIFHFVNCVSTKQSEGCVEKWLKELHAEIGHSLRLAMRNSIDNFDEETWISRWPTQVLLTVTKIMFTINGVRAIKNNCLMIYGRQIQDNIEKLVSLLRTKQLSNNTAGDVKQIIIMLINNKDIINNLLENQVKTDHDFKWLSQLRYYIIDGRCVVKMLDNTIIYGNEYLGNNVQVVMTPEADRCFYNLMIAYKYHLCGNCQGPTSSGKTETINSLVRALAVHCVFFTCSKSLKFGILLNFLKGIALEGSWLCLEEFDKVDLDIYSILSEEISNISKSLHCSYDKVVLHDLELQLQKCFICCTMTTSEKLPDSLKNMFRSFIMIVPDYQVITQVELCSLGYRNSVDLSKKIVTLIELITDLLPFSKRKFNLRTIKDILRNCEKFTPSIEESEEDIVSKSIRQVFVKKFPQKELQMIDEIFQTLFPLSCPYKSFSDLEAKILAVCKDSNLDSKAEFVSKIEELHEAIKRKTGVIIVGDTFTGKTTLTQVLQSVLDQIINIKTINPKTMTLTQLYGKFDKNTGQWRDGIITKYFREDSDIDEWIILDGLIDSVWVDDLNSVLDKNRNMCLGTGEILHLATNKTLIFETDCLHKASPAMVSRCGIVYLNQKLIGWHPLLTSWHQYNRFEWVVGYEEYIPVFFHWVIPPCLEFVVVDCQPLCKVNEVSLVQTAIYVFAMLMDEAYEAVRKKEEDSKNLSSWIQASFIQAVIWGIGSTLDLNCREKFDEFFKQVWKGQNQSYPYPKSLEKIEVNPPQDGMIFDHCYIYKSKGTWKFWPDILKNEKIDESNYLTDVFVPTAETIKYSALIKMYIAYNYPVLLIGPTEIGKTSSVKDTIINKLSRKVYEPSMLTFTSHQTPNETQDLILAKLVKKKSGRYGPSEGKTCVLFIDDFNIPNQEESGVKPVLELIRQLLDQKKFYHLENFKSLYIDNINIAAVMNSGFNYKKPSQRLLRHFSTFSINEICEDSIQRIFSNVLLSKWKKIGFPSDIIGTVNQIVAATYHFYKAVSNLKPTIEWNLYFFNMTNFSRVVQVCGMIKKESADGNKKLCYKLWAHEISRVLGDRLLDKDKDWFLDNIKYCISEHFKEDFDHLFENLGNNSKGNVELSKLLFGTYLDKTCERFDEADYEKLEEIATTTLKELNKNGNNMDLVFFTHALEHLSKICRVLATACSNLVQVGTCGTGRLTLVKFACAIYNQKFFYLEITKDYNSAQWRKTVKSFLKEAGGYGRPCVFFLSEDQMVDNKILQDVDYLLKTGQIPFLYSLEETEKILDLVRTTMEEIIPNVDGNSESILLYHHKLSRDNLHIIISFNPINSYFRRCLQHYPSIHKFCEIIYLREWPHESLESLASHWIKSLNIKDEDKTNIVKCFSYFHIEIKVISDNIHVTTGSYLEFVKLYVQLVSSKQTSIVQIKQKYLAALEKLSFASLQISEMQKSLADYQPQLEAMTVQAVEMAKQIETETIEVEKASSLVRKDEEIANEQAAAAQVLKLDCEADLAQAIPILEDAISALNTLKPTDITLVKSMKNPPDAIKLVMAAVCVIKDVKPDRIPDPSTGRKIIDYWGPSKRILGDMNFLQTLKDFDKDNIKPEIMVKIRKDYLPHKDFKPHTVAKASSAAEGLCKWIIAMDMYDKVAKEVAPKKEKLEKAEREYGVTMAILNEKKEQVTRIEQKLADLNMLLEEATRKQQKLQRNVDICKKKLSRAQKLIGGLSEEKIRWTNAVENLQHAFDRLPGDILLTSAIIAYLGPLRNQQRSVIFQTWFKYVQTNSIPCKQDYNFIEVFERDIDLDTWHLSGLPDNTLLIENMVIGKFSKRWPLYIDPQYQANNLIKIIEKPNRIKVTKFNCGDYLTVLKECIFTGVPLLLENVGESIEPFLKNLIIQSTFFQNERQYIKLGDEEIQYCSGFYLYMTTNLKHPTYSPHMYDKITIIDFTLNQESLQNHFLTCVTEIENPILRKVKETLNSGRKCNKDALYDIEEKILLTLSKSEVDILEDEHALQILDESKLLSKKIQNKQEESLHTQEVLNNYRTGYVAVAKHAAILYLTTFQLSKINYMYQFSYNWFIETYSESIQNAEKSNNLAKRRINLINTITYELYCKIARSIFQEDKLFFAFLICVNLLLDEGKIVKDELDFVTDSSYDDRTNGQYQRPLWLVPKIWNRIQSLTKLSTYENFDLFVLDNEKKFQDIYESSNPELQDLPEPFNEGFSRVVIIGILRSDRFYILIRNFVIRELGEKFVKPPLFDISKSFMQSHILSPLFFILNTESDPVKSLTNFAKVKHFHNKLVVVSQQSKDNCFEDLIEKAKNEGFWICLQNCHLHNYSCLCYLDLKLEEMDYNNTHENFRLWITSKVCQKIPISLLEKSVKITKEAPIGVQTKLLNLYLDDPIKSPDFFTKCPGKHEKFTRLLFNFAFFHCLVQERRNYGFYGWRQVYELRENDFLTAIHELQLIVNNSIDPLEEFLFLLEKCTHGGQIVDKIDQRQLKVILHDYIDSSIFPSTGRNMNTFKNSRFPVKTDHSDYVKHVLNLSETDNIEIFGLHSNYDRIKGLRKSKIIINSIQNAISSKMYHNSNVLDTAEIVEELIIKLPSDLPLHNKHPDPIIDSVITAEIKSYNRLSNLIRQNLLNIQQIIQGHALMTDELEIICNSIFINEVPSVWLLDSCINAESLSDFSRLLIENFHYFKDLSDGSNKHIWLRRFFRPKAFLTAYKLSYSKTFTVPMEKILIYLRSTDKNVNEYNGDSGILVSGIYFIGGRWNEEKECLDEMWPNILHHAVPTVIFSFVIGTAQQFDKFYDCPLYKTITCFQEESSQEWLSNFVSSVLIRSKECSSIYIKRGTCLACRI